MLSVVTRWCSGQQRFELSPEEEVDPCEQDRRHAANLAPAVATAKAPMSYERGLELIRAGEYFAAHEDLEIAWRAAPPAERDFFQGLVHVTVAWYQAGRGNRVGCERQLEKAQRRLGPYAPSHRGLDVAAVLGSVEAAAALVSAGRWRSPRRCCGQLRRRGSGRTGSGRRAATRTRPKKSSAPSATRIRPLTTWIAS